MEGKVWIVSKLKGYNQFLFQTGIDVGGLRTIIEERYPEHREHVWAIVNGIEVKMDLGTEEDDKATGFSVTTDDGGLLANISLESDEVIVTDGYKVMKHTKKEPPIFKRMSSEEEEAKDDILELALKIADILKSNSNPHTVIEIGIDGIKKVSVDWSEPTEEWN